MNFQINAEPAAIASMLLVAVFFSLWLSFYQFFGVCLFKLITEVILFVNEIIFFNWLSNQQIQLNFLAFSVEISCSLVYILFAKQ